MFLFPYTIYIWCIINADKCPYIYLPLVKNCRLWYLPLVKNCEFRYLSVGQTTLPLPAYGGAASSVPMLCKNNLTVTILVMFSHTTLHILTPEKNSPFVGEQTNECLKKSVLCLPASSMVSF